MEWMLLPFRRYAEFSGRSRRIEFWMFYLLQLIVYAVLWAIMFSGFPLADMMALDEEQMTTVPAFGITFFVGMGLLSLWWLATLIPTIAVTVRRFHDRDMSGWWYLGFIVLMLIPFVSVVVALAFLVLMFLDGTPGPNRYGPDPKGRTEAGVFS